MVIMKKSLMILTALLILPCTAGKDDPDIVLNSVITSAQIAILPWKVMGSCGDKTQICIYLDTEEGYIVEFRRLDDKKFSIINIDRPVSVNELQEGSFLTEKYKNKKLKKIAETLLTVTYEAKRGKIIVEVNPDNSRIRNLSFIKQ